MKIRTLQLSQFRNIENTVLNAHPDMNILVGDNGQGKTNIIEAIVYLSFGQSFRVKQDALLIKHDSPFAKIAVQSDQNESLDIVISKGSKYITRNEIPLKKLSDLIGLINVVLFEPEDINFFTSAPSVRRREIDYELGKADHHSLMLLNHYRKLLSMRNAALKSESIDLDYIAVIDEELIHNSVLLIEKRARFITLINPFIEKYYQLLSNSLDVVLLEYNSIITPDTASFDAIQTLYKNGMKRDQQYRMTQIGIHKDDYTFTINQLPAHQVASQGQRRMIMLAYKFALVDYFKKYHHVNPILCLDDLYSELDQRKREALLKWMPKDIQIFISTTDPGFIHGSGNKKTFHIHNGSIIKEAN